MRAVATKTAPSSLAELRAWAETEAERRHRKVWGDESEHWKSVHMLELGSTKRIATWAEWVQVTIGVHARNRREHGLKERICAAMQQIHKAIEDARADPEVWANVAEAAPAVRDVKFDPIGLRLAVPAAPTPTDILKRVQEVFAEWYGPLWRKRGAASGADLTILSILAGYTSEAIQAAPDLATAIEAAKATAARSVVRRRAQRRRDAAG